MEEASEPASVLVWARSLLAMLAMALALTLIEALVLLWVEVRVSASVWGLELVLALVWVSGFVWALEWGWGQARNRVGVPPAALPLVPNTRWRPRAAARPRWS